MQSAQIAAASIVQYLDDEKAGLEPYTQALEQAVLPDIEVARRLHDAFYLCPSAFIAIEKVAPVLSRAMKDFSRGRATYMDFSRGLRPVWPMLKFVSHLRRTLSSSPRLFQKPPCPQGKASLRDVRHRLGSAKDRVCDLKDESFR